MLGYRFGRLNWIFGVALAIGFVFLGLFAMVRSVSNSWPGPLTLSQPALKDPIPATFFGMTINHLHSTPWPSIPFASIRTWDTGVVWSNLNPASGVYTWEGLDWLINLSQDRGVDLVFTFGSTPRWVSSKPNTPTPYGPGLCAPPGSLKYWDEFVQAIVMRAHNRIKFWEIWNEPQDASFYCGDIAAMSELQRRAYKIIKTVDPEAKVLTPSPVGRQGLKWMADFLATGAGEYADIAAFHGYWDTTAESIKSVIEYYRQVFDQGGQGKKPVWDTEASWGENARSSDPDAQAAFLAKYYLLHWSGGVSRFFWYSYDNVLFGGLWDSATGLHKAGLAYREIHKWMIGAAISKPCGEVGYFSGVWTCDFSRPNGYVARVVWRHSGQSAYRPSDQFRQYRDLDGGTYQVNGEVQIGTKPILLENMSGF